MKIAFVYDAVYPWITGGAQKRVWELARRLTENHEVHWYGQKYWEGQDVIDRDGVILHGVCEPKDLYVDDRRSISQALYFTAHLIPAIIGTDYDVIDCQEFPYFPCYVSWLSSVFDSTKLFITWYEVWGDYWKEYLGVPGYIGKQIEKSVANLSATHVATSEMTKSELHKLGAEDVQVSPLGIDFKQLEEIEPIDKEIDILFGGRLIPEKNAVLFVEAVGKLDSRGYNVNTLLIGEGPDRENVEEKINELDIKESVGVTDFVDHDEFLGHIKSADVFAFPSQREGFGLVGLEALACGTPVVTSNHPQNAAQELIDPGQTGHICDLTPSDLASKLLEARLIDSEACKEAARRYDWNQITEDMIDLYEAT